MDLSSKQYANLLSLTEGAIKKKHALFLYRSPPSENFSSKKPPHIELLIAFAQKPSSIPKHASSLGFVLHPFEKKKELKSKNIFAHRHNHLLPCFYPAGLHYTQTGKKDTIRFLPARKSLATFWQKLTFQKLTKTSHQQNQSYYQELLQKAKASAFHHQSASTKSIAQRLEFECKAITAAQVEAEKKQFLHKVQKAIDLMKKAEKNAHSYLVDLQKVVLSSRKRFAFTRKKNDKQQLLLALAIFLSLQENHLNAFVCLHFSAEWGVWLSATPETLLEKSTLTNTLATCSLAGTQLYQADKSLSDTLWSDKEIEEQALVTKDIIEDFKSIRLREFDLIGPKTMRAGHLLHLKSSFIIYDKTKIITKKLVQLLSLLHPTAAICGFPRKSAKHFIEQNDKNNRKLFCGFIGVVVPREKMSFYVHIRCLHIDDKGCTIYAGAGITAASQPKREWQEINWKYQTFLK